MHRRSNAGGILSTGGQDRAGELVTIRVPTEREEQVRDLVRCRGTFQREILKSRFRRFENPGKLMACLGLEPSEHSSGATRRQGSITQAGNSRARHVLVLAAWTYRFAPRRGAVLKRRLRSHRPSTIPQMPKRGGRPRHGRFTDDANRGRPPRQPIPGNENSNSTEVPLPYQ